MTGNATRRISCLITLDYDLNILDKDLITPDLFGKDSQGNGGVFRADGITYADGSVYLYGLFNKNITGLTQGRVTTSGIVKYGNPADLDVNKNWQFTSLSLSHEPCIQNDECASKQCVDRQCS